MTTMTNSDEQRLNAVARLAEQYARLALDPSDRKAEMKAIVVTAARWTTGVEMAYFCQQLVSHLPDVHLASMILTAFTNHVLTVGKPVEQRAGEMHAGKSYAAGDTYRCDNGKRLTLMPGLFIYSGFGMGHYYGADGVTHWTNGTGARERARAEGVTFAWCDALTGR